ncbi:MAG: response regulator [Treponema sp.]|jgi:signal transduction histidine kinase/CheY-like chemotaxis protein/HPt (histidine-containing phosphotransfer) domain-containing protein|nr:response regulator [Treponema sp.]
MKVPAFFKSPPFFLLSFPFLACAAASPSFYISLTGFPAYVKGGFDSRDLLPRFDPSQWTWFEQGDRPLLIKDMLPDPGGEKRFFLSPRREKDREFTILLRFVMEEETLQKFRGDPSLVPGMFFAALGDNWEIYLNGGRVRSEIHLDGEGRILSRRSWRGVYFPVDPSLFTAGVNRVILRIAGPPRYAKTGLFYAGPYYTAPYDYIAGQNSGIPVISLGAVYLFVGIYQILLFISRRSERYNLYYGFFSLFLGVYVAARSSAGQMLIPDANILIRLEYGSLFLILPALMAFVDRLSKKRVRMITKLYGLACLFFALSAALFPLEYGEDILLIWKISALLGSCYLFGYGIIFAFFSRVSQKWKNLKQRGCAFPVFWGKELLGSPLGNIFIFSGLFFVTAVLDIVNSLFIRCGGFFSCYGFFVFTLGSTLILSRKFNSLYRRLNMMNAALEESNVNLEETIRRRTRELEEQTRNAEAASRAKSDFLAQMSHEIRTPMNTILGMMELILRRDIARDLYEDALSVKRAGNTLLAIINDILDFSKIESGKLEINPVPYSLSSLINDCVSMTRFRFIKKPVLFKVGVDETLPDKLTGDESRVRQIVLNLLSNAVKYTRKGSVSFSVGGRRKGEWIRLCFTVNDTGIGIRPGDMEKLFGTFARFDLRSNRDIEGTGLGLAISRNLSRLMDGDITVESRYGEGSTFTLTLPQRINAGDPVAQVLRPETKAVILCEIREVPVSLIRKALDSLRVPLTVVSRIEDFFSGIASSSYAFTLVPPCLVRVTADFIREKGLAVQPVALALAGESLPFDNVPVLTMPVYVIPLAHVLNGKTMETGQERAAVRFTASGVKVLLVDDITTNLYVATRLLNLYHLDVDTCTSGTEALERIKNGSYDLVLMDHMMPGMDGIETAAAIRAMGREESRFRNLPLVALTANAMSGMREMFLQQGFNDYLAKPIEIAKLNEILERWIPREKQKESVPPGAFLPQGLPPEEALGNTPAGAEQLGIPGINTTQGLVTAGGSLENYREILAAFLEDAGDTLLEFQALPTEGELGIFTVKVHGIKSAAAAIGAGALSKKAAALERAGKLGDLETIRKQLPELYRGLKKTAENIRSVLDHTEKTEEGDVHHQG